MKRIFVESRSFSETVDKLIKNRRLDRERLTELLYDLTSNPKTGSVIPGLGGIRKIRLASSEKGKRGGFRVDYLDIPVAGLIHLLAIYAKNVQEDLNPVEKKAIRTLVEILKREAR